MSIRQVLMLTTLVAVAVAICIPIYRLYFQDYPTPVTLQPPYYLYDDFPLDALKQIQRDLEIREKDLCVLELTTSDRKKLGVCEEALIQSSEAGIFKLRYVYHKHLAADLESRRWRIWTNYVTIDDGTGADDPAVEEFDHLPTVEQIAAFKARTIRQ